METRANYVVIGAFTLAVIAAAFGFVFWFSGSDSGQRRTPVRVVFSGSVSGLTKGSVVLFNGIRVGEVTEISLLPEDPRRVVANMDLDRTTPVRTDTRARLEYQGLTGVAQIGLSGGEPGAPALTPGPGQPLPTIFADRSDFQDLIESARNIARRADDVLERVGRVVTDNEGSISRTVQNVERFSEALGQNAAGIDRFLEQVGQAAEKVGPLAERLETLATNVDELVRTVDRDRVARIVENIDRGTSRIGPLVDRVESLAGNADQLLQSVDRQRVARIVENVERGTERIPSVVEKIDTLATTANERIAPLAQRLETLATDASGIVQAIDRERVARIVENVEAGSARVGPTAQSLEAAAGRANALMQSVDPQRVTRIVENVERGTERIPSMVEKLDALATTANDRIGPLAQKLETVANDASLVVQAVDRQRVARIVENVENFSHALGQNREAVDKALKEAAALITQLNATAPKLDSTFTDISNLAKAVDAAKVDRTLTNVDKFAQSLGRSSDDVERTVKQARELSEKLNKSADRVDNVLKAAEGFLGAGGGPAGQGMFDDVRQAARAIRELAKNLDERSEDISVGLTRFTGQGLREYEALAVEGRRTLGDISKAVRSIERNPQQILFGGKSNIPEYNGRR
jgi:phospholipid/cholesterol/gamma-HCH transport system substrate-binding protein